MGRPCLYNQETVDAICWRIAEGESLRQVCAGDDMPGRRTVMEWLEARPEFQAQYARAHERQAEHLAAEIIEIADTEPDPHKAKVRVDARKWAASKLLPRKYGDRVELTGRDGGAIQLQAVPSDDDRARAMALLLLKAQERAEPQPTVISSEVSNANG
jgi:hypothetical protein